MTKEELIEKYGLWGEHPHYDVESWAAEAKENNIRSGYWDWVASNIEMNNA